MTLFERVHLPSFAGATEWLGMSHPVAPPSEGMCTRASTVT